MNNPSIGMSSEPSLYFSYESIVFEGNDITDRWQLLLDVTGIFYIKVNSQVLYEQPSFSLVEFGVIVKRWLALEFHDHLDLIYNPTEFADEGHVKIIAVGDYGWQIRSVYENYTETNVFSNQIVEAACQAFLQQLETDLKDKFGLAGLPPWSLYNQGWT